jgi:hypothetical protein
MTEDTGTAEPECELDLLAAVAAHLAREMRRAIPVAECLRIFWARAEAVRGIAPDEQIAKAFLAVAERSGLISRLGYHGGKDVRHVLDWALHSRIPF